MNYKDCPQGPCDLGSAPTARPITEAQTLRAHVYASQTIIMCRLTESKDYKLFMIAAF
jgi:hypothetical protein